MSAHLKKQSPLPDLWTDFDNGRLSPEDRGILYHSVTLGLIVEHAIAGGV